MVVLQQLTIVIGQNMSKKSKMNKINLRCGLITAKVFECRLSNFQFSNVESLMKLLCLNFH